MMVLGARCSPPKVAGVPHFPRLSEHNVRESFLGHDEFLSVRGAADNLAHAHAGVIGNGDGQFDRDNVTSEEDLRQASERLDQYIQKKTVTVPVTVGQLNGIDHVLTTTQAIDKWRRGRDLNSRSSCPDSGFQDRHVRPLRHPSTPTFG
jgi:hypothetical protein